jgi:hypothetical protein
MQKINWDKLGLKGENKQKSFEDICMFLCCRELKISKIDSYQNQPGIETEPFEVNGRKYGFQAKFFDVKFDWTQVKKSIFKSIEESIFDIFNSLQHKNIQISSKDFCLFSPFKPNLSQLIFCMPKFKFKIQLFYWFITIEDSMKHWHIKNQWMCTKKV